MWLHYVIGMNDWKYYLFHYDILKLNHDVHDEFTAFLGLGASDKILIFSTECVSTDHLYAGKRWRFWPAITRVEVFIVNILLRLFYHPVGRQSLFINTSCFALFIHLSR